MESADLRGDHVCAPHAPPLRPDAQLWLRLLDDQRRSFAVSAGITAVTLVREMPPSDLGVGAHGHVAPVAAAAVTQGLYAREQTTGDGGHPIRPLARDPLVGRRIWAVGHQFGQVGYSDDDGTTFVGKTASPDPSQGIQQLVFSPSLAWLLTSEALGSQKGKLFRSPLPDANGNGLAWEQVFDLATFPGGVNSTFRNSCLAVWEPHVYLLEYSSATIPGGPSLYWSDANGQSGSWTKQMTWASGKHGHAVKVIDGVPWAMIGDLGSEFTDIGLWATDKSAASWSQKSIYGDNDGGRYLTGINFFPVEIGEQPMIVAEQDTHHGHGPLLYPSVDKGSSMAFIPLCQLPPPYVGTMRQLTLTSEGNLMWVTTGEGGSVGPLDSVWIAPPPFTSAVRLEAVPSNVFGTLGDPVENGPYVFFDTYRVTKEKFIGQ